MHSTGLLALGLVAAVKAQPFCNDALLAVSPQLQEVCCADAASCRDGVPSSCNSACAAIWVPFVEECTAFLDETFGAQFSAFSEMCLDISFGTDAPCNAAYEASGRLDVRSACCGGGGGDDASCDANGFPTGQCHSRCMPVFEQYFARCTDSVKQSGYTSQQYQEFARSCHEGALAHDDCRSGPCQNGGDCQNDSVNGGYTCTCASGFEGANCEHTLREACNPGTLETAQWRGDYFSHPDLDEGGSRRPHHSACEDAMPHYAWGDGGPEHMAKSRDNFSVRWTSYITLVAGAYEIAVTSDDGSRVLIDGIVVLDHWLECCNTWSTRVSLPAGQHQIVYEYRELAGDANAALDITFITHGIVQVTSAQIESGDLLQGEVDVAGSHQQYRFAAVAGVTYSVDAQPTGISGITVTLYDNDDVTVLASGNNFEWTALASGNNLVQIEGSSPTDTGSYTLAITSSGGPCGPGGQQLDATQAGQILFYDVPHAAENNAACEWHLFCEEGQTVALAFGRFDTEEGYDFVNVYDGISTANTLLGSFSGTNSPVVGATSGSTMLVTFETDGSVIGHGFDARFSCSGEGVAAIELNPGPPARMSLGRGEIGVYIFEAVAGTTYIISLRPTPGHDVDVTGTPSFRLLDDNHQQLDQVTVSADSGILTFSCATTGAYRVIVSSGVGDGGDFMLSYIEAADACGGVATRVFPTHDGVIDRASLPVGAACVYTVSCLPGENVLVDLQGSRDIVSVVDQGSGALPIPASGRVTSTTQSVTLTATATVPDQTLKVSHGCRGGDILTIEVGIGARVSSVEHSPGPPGMEKQFQFTAVAGATYQLETELLGLPDSVMTLYDTDAQTVLAENDDNPAQGGGLSSYIEWTCPADGTYVVGVRGFNPSQSGEFSLSITELQASGSPCQGGLDLPTPTGAIDFFDGTSEGQDCNWHLDCGSEQTASVTFDALATEAGYDFVWIFDGDSHDDSVIIQLDGNLGDPCSSQCGPYLSTGSRVTIAFTSDSSVNDQGFRASYTCNGQGPDTLPSMVTTDGTPFSGTVTQPGDQVYYRFAAEAGHTYQIETQLDGLPDTVLDLLDVDGETQLLTNDDAPGAGGALSSAVEWTCPTSGIYYIMVRAYDPLSQTGGFLLVVTEATAAGGDDPCQGGVNLPPQGGVIDYFAGHPDGVQCSWSVNCPVGSEPSVTFTQFDTEANFDFVDIWYADVTTGDADVRLSGTFGGDGFQPERGRAYVSSTNSLTLQFTADGSVSGQGFVADYSCGDARVHPPTIAFGAPQSGTFAEASQVSYTVSATAGHSYDISTQSAVDLTVTLYDSDGQTQLFQNSGGHIEWLCARSGQYIIDLSVSHLALGSAPSFTMTVAEASSHCYTDAACHNPDEEHSTACLMANVSPLEVSNHEGDITLLVPFRLPGDWTDAVFPDSTGCAWTFSCPAGQHVLLEASRMDLESCCDWVDVYDSDEIPEYEDDRFPSESARATLLRGPQSADTSAGTWSNSDSTGSRLESSGPVMSMAFHADENVMRSGFDIHYSCVDAASVASCSVGQWLEQFWATNEPGDGEPLYSACISQNSINYDWGSGGPDQLGGDVTDNFSSRWTGTVMLYDPADGTRQQNVDVIFAAHSDDGSRIYIDGELVLDHWADCCTTWYTDTLTLSPGPHNIIYEMRENGGAAYAELTWEIVTPTVIPDCPQGQWTAQYWSNPSMDGEPDSADCFDGELNFNFDELGGGPPQLQGVTDNFSVRWSATLAFAPGEYILHSHSDDGSRVTVNGNLVLDHWHECCRTWDSEPIELQGDVDIIYEMEENGGGANAHLWWSEIPPPAVCTSSQWSAEFFNNNQLQGAPVATGCADAIDFDFDATGGGPPELGGAITDNFSIRWSRVVSFSAGNYHFTARSDDGSRVFVDGQSVLDHWNECCATWVSEDVAIEAGDHAVVYEFYENGGQSYASLSWEAVAGGASITVAGDNQYELWVNGQQQGSGDDWTTATTYSVDIDEDYLARNEAVIAIHGIDSGPPGGIIAVTSQGSNTYMTGVDDWYCWNSPDGTDAAPHGDWALPGYDYLSNGFQPAVVIAQYGRGAWGSTDLCRAGQCRDKSIFTDASWIWSTPYASGDSSDVSSLFAYCRLSLGVSSTPVVDPPPPANPSGENDQPCRTSSTATCADLGWSVRPGTGFDAVCAASTAVGCVGDATFTTAQQTCVQAGGRLCTADEILARVTQGSGCSFDNQRIWTSDRSVADPVQQCRTNAYVTMRGTGQNSGNPDGDWPVMCTPVDERAAVRCCADSAPGESSCSCSPGSWLAQYYQDDNAQLATADTPAVAADMEVCQLGNSPGETISYQWGAGGPVQLPGVTDHFTVRWTGSITFEATARGWPIVTFSVSSDDGSRLWVDGTMVLDHMAECCSTWRTEPSQIASGTPHNIVYVMQENGGGAYAVLEWTASATPPPPPATPCPAGLIFDESCTPAAGCPQEMKCSPCPVGTFGPGGTVCIQCASGTIDHDQDPSTPCRHQAAAPPPPPEGGCSLSVVTVNAGVGTGAAYTAYQAVVTMGPAAANIYTIFGSSVSAMVLPPAFQVPTPFGVDLGGTNPQFWAFNADAEFDSWLTVGLTQGEDPTALSSVGLDLANWDLDHGLSADNGAVFWMDPGAGPSTPRTVVAQLTVPVSWPSSWASTTSPIALCAQGRLRDGGDWQQCMSAVGGAGGGGH